MITYKLTIRLTILQYVNKISKASLQAMAWYLTIYERTCNEVHFYSHHFKFAQPVFRKGQDPLVMKSIFIVTILNLHNLYSGKGRIPEKKKDSDPFDPLKGSVIRMLFRFPGSVIHRILQP